MNSVFVDADILLYSEDGADLAKQQTALAWLRTLWEQGTGRTAAQALGEFYLMATRKLQPSMPPGDARAEVRRYELWEPWQTDHATVESAWAIESRYGLAYWDCLIVAAAQHLGCRYLLSESLVHEEHFGGVQVINPFKTGIHILSSSS